MDNRSCSYDDNDPPLEASSTTTATSPRKKVYDKSSSAENSAKKICLVCGDKALGYNFNAISCESCKAFFRRNALKQKVFKCPFREQCEITILSRRFCQKCRLRKCLQVGMLTDLIMTSRNCDTGGGGQDESAATSMKFRKRRRQQRDSNVSILSSMSGGSGSGSGGGGDYGYETQTNTTTTTTTSMGIGGGNEGEVPRSISPPTAAASIINSNHPAQFFAPLHHPVEMMTTVGGGEAWYGPEKLNNFYVNEIQQQLGRGHFKNDYEPEEEVDYELKNNNNYGQMMYLNLPTVIDPSFDDDRRARFRQRSSNESSSNDASSFDNNNCRRLSSPIDNDHVTMMMMKMEHDDDDDDDNNDEDRMRNLNPQQRGGADQLQIHPQRMQDICDEWNSPIMMDFCSNNLSALKLFRLEELLSANEIMAIPAGGPPISFADSALAAHMGEVCIRLCFQVSKRIQAFRNLLPMDQITLLKGAATELMAIRGLMVYQKHVDSWRPVGFPHRYLPLSCVPTRDSLVKVYSLFPDEWRTSEPIMLCLSSIVLFDPARPNLRDKDSVHILHEFYHDLLKDYLKLVYIDGDDVYSRLCQLLIHLRKTVPRISAAARVNLDPQDVEVLSVTYDWNPSSSSSSDGDRGDHYHHSITDEGARQCFP